MTYPDGLRISEMTYAPGARLVMWISPAESVIKMPFWVRVESPMTPSRPTSQPAAVVTLNSAPGKRLARGAVPLLDDQLTLGLVLEG